MQPRMLSFITSRAAGRRLATVLALAVLAVIAFDLGDAGCDPLAIGLGGARVTAAPEAATDGCADLCLPDCFCCASTVAAIPPVTPLRPAAAANAPAMLVTPAVPGFSPLVEHVPLLLL